MTRNAFVAPAPWKSVALSLAMAGSALLAACAGDSPTDSGGNGGDGGNSGEPSWFSGNWDVPTAKALSPACGTGATLTVLPAAIADIAEGITPLGFMQPGSHATPVPHMYFNTGSTGAGTDEQGRALVSRRVEVRAPAAATVKGALKIVSQSTVGSVTEYSVGLHVCGQRWIAFNHLDDLNPKIMSAIGSATRVSCNGSSCMYEGLDVALAAGERIGRSSGRSAGFDFGATSTAAPMSRRVNPKAWSPRWSAGVCPLDWFDSSLKSQLYGIVQRSDEPRCGSIGYDIAHTASGVWLGMSSLSQAQMEDRHIALAGDWAAAGTRVFSIGNEASVPGLPAGVYVFTPVSSGTRNRDFGDVGAGTVVCYDQLTGRGQGQTGQLLDLHILLDVTVAASGGATETLRIAGAAGQCGAGPYTLPTSTRTFGRITP